MPPQPFRCLVTGLRPAFSPQCPLALPVVSKTLRPYPSVTPLSFKRCHTLLSTTASRRPASTISQSLHTAHRPPTFLTNLRSSILTNTRSFHTSKPRAQEYRRFDGSRFAGTRAGRFIYLLQRWGARPTFYYEVGGIGVAAGIFYVYNLEEVPYSGRRRFNVVSPEREASLSQEQYRTVMRQYGHVVLPGHDRRTKQVHRVLERLLSANDLADKGEWTVHVLDTPDANAFVIPGGHVFVFAGIFPVCRDDEGLATVLSHEIGHNLAHHIGESMSRGGILMPFIYVLDFAFGIPASLGNVMLSLAFENPGNRRQESEADSIGLMMMAQACYDPGAAVQFWERMHEDAQKKQGGEIPQFLSTHPSHGTREKALQMQLPQAELRRDAAGCGGMGQVVDGFRRGMGRLD